MLYRTRIRGCPDLHLAAGLETVSHLGTSAVDVATLRASVARLPDAFLAGVGLAAAEIAGLRALFPAPPRPSPQPPAPERPAPERPADHAA
jgi:hypothetical protein